MAITRRRFLVASAVAIPGAATAVGKAGSSVEAVPQSFTMSGRGTSVPSKSPAVAAGLLKGTLGNCLFEAVPRPAGGLTIVAEFTNGILRGYVRPDNPVAGCEKPASWNGVLTSGVGRFAGLKGTFFMATTPLYVNQVDRKVPGGFTLKISGRFS